jgi:hypothetical protein
MVFDGALEEAKIVVVMELCPSVIQANAWHPLIIAVEFALLGSQVFVELVVNNLPVWRQIKRGNELEG